jgi:hypothetical protein
MSSHKHAYNNRHLSMLLTYCIAGNLRGVQFLRMGSLQSFRGLIFADAGDHHAHYTLYNRTYFADSRLSAKTAKIGPHENFPLYGSISQCWFWLYEWRVPTPCKHPGYRSVLHTIYGKLPCNLTCTPKSTSINARSTEHSDTCTINS